jgi:hypothetical protein
MEPQDKKWWYAAGDQRFWPFSPSELKTMANSGKIVSTPISL